MRKRRRRHRFFPTSYPPTHRLRLPRQVRDAVAALPGVLLVYLDHDDGGGDGEGVNHVQ